MQAPTTGPKLLAVIGAALGGFLIRADRIFRAYSYEHELLLLDLCERKNMKLEDLPTRTRKIR